MPDEALEVNTDLDDLRAIREEIKRRNADLKRIQQEAQRSRRDNRDGDPFGDSLHGSTECTPSTASFAGWRSGSSSDAPGTIRDRCARDAMGVSKGPVDLDEACTMDDINAWLIHCGVTPFAPFVNLSALMEFTIEQLKFRLESADAAIMIFNRLRRLQRQGQKTEWPRHELRSADGPRAAALSDPLRGVPVRLVSSPVVERRQASPGPPGIAPTSNPRTMSPVRDTLGRPRSSPHTLQSGAASWCTQQSTAAARGGQFADSSVVCQRSPGRGVAAWTGGQSVPSGPQQWHPSWQPQSPPTNLLPSQWPPAYPTNTGHHPSLHGWRPVPEQATRADGAHPRCVGPIRSPQRAASP
mmetsp:Transcript_56810/g.124593  ORF Transcript_56810/g.124593 Transcript_56810/m.124593 type:complete len:355 (+) Transcript_56810:35-1099(+)